MQLSPPLVRLLDRAARSFRFPAYAFWLLVAAYASQGLACLAYSLEAMTAKTFLGLLLLNGPVIVMSWAAHAWRRGVFTRGVA